HRRTVLHPARHHLQQLETSITGHMRRHRNSHRHQTTVPIPYQSPARQTGPPWRLQLSNAIRGFAAEFGLTAATGSDHLGRLVDCLAIEEDLPILARELFTAQATEYAQVQAKISEVDAKLAAWQKTEPRCQRLVKIPGSLRSAPHSS